MKITFQSFVLFSTRWRSSPRWCQVYYGGFENEHPLEEPIGATSSMSWAGQCKNNPPDGYFGCTNEYYNYWEFFFGVPCEIIIPDRLAYHSLNSVVCVAWISSFCSCIRLRSKGTFEEKFIMLIGVGTHGISRRTGECQSGTLFWWRCHYLFSALTTSTWHGDAQIAL